MDLDDDSFLAFGNDEKGDVPYVAYGDRSTIPTLQSRSVAPWLSCNCSNADENSPNLVRLHNEILDFFAFVYPTSQEKKIRKKALREMSSIINELFPTCTIDVFGSQMTKILTPTSDLDIAVMNVPSSFKGLEPLYMIRDAVVSRDLVSYVEVLSNAKVPILKLDHKSSGVAFDILLNNDSGITTGNMVLQTIEDFPQLKYLAIVLKIYLGQRKLNDTYTGGIGSYLLCSMITSFLQQRLKIEAYRSIPLCWNLGSLLLDFFALYGGTGSFNYYHTAICTRGTGRYFNKRQPLSDKWDAVPAARVNLLAIENPDMPEVDMGRNSYIMPKIRRSFEHGYQVLSSAIGSNTTASDKTSTSILSYIIRADDPVFTDRVGVGERWSADVNNTSSSTNVKSKRAMSAIDLIANTVATQPGIMKEDVPLVDLVDDNADVTVKENGSKVYCISDTDEDCNAPLGAASRNNSTSSSTGNSTGGSTVLTPSAKKRLKRKEAKRKRMSEAAAIELRAMEDGELTTAETEEYHTTNNTLLASHKDMKEDVNGHLQKKLKTGPKGNRKKRTSHPSSLDNM